EVGDRFRPDLVIVGFFENDLTDNAPIAHPGPVTVAAYRALSYARRHMYSLELYKQVYLTARWRLSGSDEYRRRVEHLGTEEGLLARASDATVLREQQLTAFDRFTDDEVAQNRCVYGMKENPAAVAALERAPLFRRWMAAVRGFQRLQREGRFRIIFFANDVPPTGGDEHPDFFYDGGSGAFDRLYVRVMGEGTAA